MEIKYFELQEIVEFAGIEHGDDEDDTIRSDYSGRGMYGKTCFGLVLDHPSELVSFTKELARRYHQPDDDFDELSDEMREFYEVYLERMSQDSMGRSAIYYWPRVQVVS